MVTNILFIYLNIIWTFLRYVRRPTNHIFRCIFKGEFLSFPQALTIEIKVLLEAKLPPAWNGSPAAVVGVGAEAGVQKVP